MGTSPSLFTVVLLLLLVVNCAFSSLETQSKEKDIPVVFTEEDSGRSVAMKLDDGFRIELKGNPTTGYSWHMVEPENDLIIKLTGQEYTPESERTGSSGTRTFHFKAAGKGRTKIRLVYRRSWEKDTPPSREFEIDVQVREET